MQSYIHTCPLFKLNQQSQAEPGNTENKINAPKVLLLLLLLFAGLSFPSSEREVVTTQHTGWGVQTN